MMNGCRAKTESRDSWQPLILASWKIPTAMESKKRILVVDDEQEITLVLRSGLATHGYEVRVAGEGEAALELFQAWTPDLVVTDLSMPNMNGLKLCQRLREI